MSDTSHRLPRWIIVWLVVGTTIVLWDVSFVLLRPASLDGGTLYEVYRVPYATYVTVDHSYADLDQPFVRAQAIVSLIEALIVGAALAASWRSRLAVASLLAFCASSLTAAKTLLILAIELVSGGANVGHNPIGVLITSWLLPNGVWIVMPLFVVWWTGRFLVRGATPTLRTHPLALEQEPA